MLHLLLQHFIHLVDDVSVVRDVENQLMPRCPSPPLRRRVHCADYFRAENKHMVKHKVSPKLFLSVTPPLRIREPYTAVVAKYLAATHYHRLLRGNIAIHGNTYEYLPGCATC